MICWIQVLVSNSSKKIFKCSEEQLLCSVNLFCLSLKHYTFPLPKRVWEDWSKFKILMQTSMGDVRCSPCSPCPYNDKLCSLPRFQRWPLTFCSFYIIHQNYTSVQRGGSWIYWIHLRSEWLRSSKLDPYNTHSYQLNQYAKCLWHMKHRIRTRFPTHNLLHSTTKEHLLPLSSESSLLLGSRCRFMISPGNSRQPGKQWDST